MRNVFLFISLITLCLYSCTNELTDQDQLGAFTDAVKVKGELIIEVQEDWIDGDLIVLGYQALIKEEETNEIFKVQMTSANANDYISDSGSKVEINGTLSEEKELLISDLKVIEKNVQQESATGERNGKGSMKTMLVVMVSDTASAPSCSTVEIEDDIVGANNDASAANLYSISSKGKFTISSVSFAEAFIEDVICSPSALHSNIEPQLIANGTNPDDYDYVMYVTQGRCSYGGAAQLGRPQFHNDLCSWNVVTPHELGHALGMNHAAIGLNPDFFNSSEAYGDRSDFMGVVYKELNAPHRISMGWLAKKSIKALRGGGSFEIAPLHTSPKNTPQVLKILDTYYVSYRAAQGVFDSDMNTDFSDKVHIHAWNGDRRAWTRYLVGLGIGESFTLPEGGVVTFIDFQNGAAIVSVQ